MEKTIVLSEDLEKRRLEAVSKIKEWLSERRDRSQNQFASLIGKAPAQITGLIQCSYSGNFEKLLDAVESCFANEIEKERLIYIPDPPTTETYQYKLVRSLIRHCHMTTRIGIIIGDTGLGKTVAAQEYANTEPGAYYLEAMPSITSVSRFYQEVGDAIGIKKANSYDREKLILATLSSQGAVLIIDEAHNLSSVESKSTKMHETIKAMNNKGIAIAMIGNPTVEDQIENNKAVGFLQQFTSRTCWEKLNEKNKKKQFKNVIRRKDLEMLIENYLETKLDPDIYDFLEDIANGYKGTGWFAVVYLLKIAVARAKSHNKAKLPLSYLEDAVEYLNPKAKPDYNFKYKGFINDKTLSIKKKAYRGNKPTFGQGNGLAIVNG